MRIFKVFALSALTVLAAAGCGQKYPKALADLNLPKDVADSVARLIPAKGLTDTISYGMGQRLGLMFRQSGLNDLNLDKVLSGFKDVVFAKGDINDTTFIKQFKMFFYDPDMQQAWNTYMFEYDAYSSAVHSIPNKMFLDENAAKEGVSVTESGLQYAIAEQGGGVRPGAKDTVKVNYVGKLIDGTVFDQSSEPVTFSLDRVIKGWAEGLQLINEGGKATLFIPYDLAYGIRGTGDGKVPPYSTLIFDVELLEVHPFVAAEEKK